MDNDVANVTIEEVIISDNKVTHTTDSKSKISLERIKFRQSHKEKKLKEVKKGTKGKSE